MKKSKLKRRARAAESEAEYLRKQRDSYEAFRRWVHPDVVKAYEAEHGKLPYLIVGQDLAAYDKVIFHALRDNLYFEQVSDGEKE